MTSFEMAALRWLAASENYRRETQAALEGLSCVYCGGPAQTMDHVIPRAIGGPDDPANLLPACRSCNGSKSARRLQAWVEWMRVVARRLPGAERVLAALGDVSYPIADDFDEPEFLAAWEAAERRTA